MQDSDLGGQEGQDGNSAAAANVERSEAYIMRLARVREQVDIAKATAEGVANVMSGSEVADAVVRVPGGVTLIGSVLSIAGICIGIAKLVAQSQDDRDALGDLCERGPQMASRFSHTLFTLLRA